MGAARSAWGHTWKRTRQWPWRGEFGPRLCSRAGQPHSWQLAACTAGRAWACHQLELLRSEARSGVAQSAPCTAAFTCSEPALSCRVPPMCPCKRRQERGAPGAERGGDRAERARHRAHAAHAAAAPARQVRARPAALAAQTALAFVLLPARLPTWQRKRIRLTSTMSAPLVPWTLGSASVLRAPGVLVLMGVMGFPNPKFHMPNPKLQTCSCLPPPRCAARHTCSNLPEPLVLNNLDWFGGMGLLTFLREIGKWGHVWQPDAAGAAAGTGATRDVPPPSCRAASIGSGPSASLLPQLAPTCLCAARVNSPPSNPPHPTSPRRTQLPTYPHAPLRCLWRAGKYARVGTMLGKESVRKRMESETGISYTEFTYQLLQASAGPRQHTPVPAWPNPGRSRARCRARQHVPNCGRSPSDSLECR